jgi:hypothetical protein
MKPTRRRFLTAALGVTGGLLAASAGVPGGPRTVYRRLAFPQIAAAPTGPLPEPVLEVLLATTETLTGRPVELGHYADFFRWRAEHLAGHGALYTRFAETADRAARAAAGRPFLAVDHGMRRKVLEPAFAVRGARGRLQRLRLGVTEREWILFEEHIVREIQLLFAATDAWTRAGYEGWPGRPRGLAAYQLPPPAQRRS